ncbi:helix-turn-helix domain-containing protein [Lactococcus lactis]|uniref:helix-turn-helix domain-containing protein n=1 Tax=Lactococcus lactis TaxID=1358 RepID=UPI001D184E82|nr:helix-turn-helix transcriptional regulator [Lactococcus lactis]MCC4121326.1 helix-turn-helix transcriptional regulator [Lactococcus lactis]
MNIFSERLKIALSEKNMKASELSELTGISKSSISDWINGRYEAKQDKIFLIAKALKINEGYLLGLDVPMTEVENTPNSHPYIEETIKAIKQLTLYQQEQLLKLTRYNLDDISLEILEILSNTDENFKKDMLVYTKFKYLEYEKLEEEKNADSRNTAG